MAYVSIRFDAEGDTAEAWADALLAHGALAVDATDPAAGTDAEVPLYDEPGEAPANWKAVRLSVLLGDASAAEALIAAAAAEVGRPLPPHEVFVVPDHDWVRATQAQFGPIAIAEGLWIVPSWSPPVDAPGVKLVLDPGLAFGTGSHPTTRLCLQWLASELRPGEDVLDYGCGSGILAIAAARLGASEVVGTDIDPQALRASGDNALRNGVAVRFVPTEEVPQRGFHVVVANILANPLRLLAPALAARVRPGGRIVLSGILSEQAREVTAAYREWFRIGVWKEDDGWVALAGERYAPTSVSAPSNP